MGLPVGTNRDQGETGWEMVVIRNPYRDYPTLER